MIKINDDEIKIVICDFDGTLRDYETNIIHQQTIEQIQKAVSDENYFVMCTGNLLYEMKKSIDLLTTKITNKFNKYFIGCNGNGVTDIEKNETNILTSFSQDELVRIIKIFEKNKLKNYDVTSFDLEYIYYSNLDYMRFMIDQKLHEQDYLHRLPLTQKILDDFGRCPKITIHKIDLEQRKKVFDDIKKEFPDLSIEYTWFTPDSVDLQIIGTSKFTGIEQVLKMINSENKTNYTLDNVIYFGDAHNDLSVFEKLKYAIAMENATDEIKEKAYEITTTCVNGGVGEYLIKINK